MLENDEYISSERHDGLEQKNLHKIDQRLYNILNTYVGVKEEVKNDFELLHYAICNYYYKLNKEAFFSIEVESSIEFEQDGEAHISGDDNNQTEPALQRKNTTAALKTTAKVTINKK